MVTQSPSSSMYEGVLIANWTCKLDEHEVELVKGEEIVVKGIRRILELGFQHQNHSKS